jgi:hypothetical protein
MMMMIIIIIIIILSFNHVSVAKIVIMDSNPSHDACTLFCAFMCCSVKLEPLVTINISSVLRVILPV